MTTIIAHGKNQWGRSNKNRRVDPELEAELNSIDLPQSTITHEAVILKNISDQVDVGTKVIKKIGDVAPAPEPQSYSSVPQSDVPTSPTVAQPVRKRGEFAPITHAPVRVEKKYKSEDVNVDIAIPVAVVGSAPDPLLERKRTRKKINKANRG